MNKIATINNLYFKEQKILSEIAGIVGTSVSYVSRILKENEEYKREKERRKQENLRQRKEKQKEIIYKNRKKKVDTEYLNMQSEHEQAVRELSKNSRIGNDALRKYCSSAYKYNSSENRYEFDTDTLLKPADFPKYIRV